jgi:hypothetical protein
MGIGRLTEAEWTDRAEAWRHAGATNLLVDTGVSSAAGDVSLNNASAQIKVLARIRESLGAEVAS